MKPIDRRPHPLIVACAVGALFILGACSSSREVSEAAALTPTGSGFSQNLHKDYVALAESELKQGDRGSATHYASKAKQAASGQAVAPDEVASRSIDPPVSTTLSDARTRLVTALGSPEATKKPEAAAKAQTMFDCWMEQQEEGWQYDDIAACRKGFDTAMLTLAPEKVAEKTPERQVVHFKFDSTELTEQSHAQMADLVREVQLAKPKSVQILSYTDLSGDKIYNAKLAAMRGKSIEDKLKDAGAEVINVDARGAVDPVVDTPKPNEQNRRAVIIFN